MNLYQWLLDEGHGGKLPKDKVCTNCGGTKRVRDAFGDEYDCTRCHLTHQINCTNALWLEALKQIEAPNLVELDEGKVLDVLTECYQESIQGSINNGVQQYIPMSLQQVAHAICQKFGKAKGKIEKRDKITGCLKGYGEHDYAVVNTHRNNILTCVNCGDEKPNEAPKGERVSVERIAEIIFDTRKKSPELEWRHLTQYSKQPYLITATAIHAEVFRAK